MEVRDPIWNFIPFNDLEKEIINHPAFQRLRRIKQLGPTEMIYPGAVHTRFEHSLGVMHLASLMFDSIIKSERNIKLLEERGYTLRNEIERIRQTIRLSALLHDIGHAPFSHTSEDIMPINDKTGRRYSHEDYTVSIIKEILKEHIEESTSNKKEYRITADEIIYLIEGIKSDDKKNSKIIEGEIIWKDLISSQLDADRGDYLLRDSYYTGVKYGIYDVWRLIATITLGINPEFDVPTLCVDRDGWHVAESLILARYMIYSQVVFHKTRISYNYHVNEVMKTFLKEKYGKETLPPPTKEGLREFLQLDDYTIWNYIKDNTKYEDCRAIIERTHIRELYRTSEDSSKKNEEKKCDRIIELLREKGLFVYNNIVGKSWYDTNTSKDLGKEIFVIDKDKKLRPLSKYSKIVSSLNSEKKLRIIYVKQKDRKKAIKILNENHIKIQV